MRLWVKLHAYVWEIRWLRLDQQVTMTTDALPGAKFVGQIAFIEPRVEPRTVKVRVDLSNPERKLKPGMHIRGVVQLPKE